MKLIVCALVAGATLTAGCATKRYPMATPLSGAEISLMNCRELMLEGVKTDEMQKQIAETSQVDWRSVAGFLGDYGIGNAMAKSEADAALSARRASINTAQAQKGCMTQEAAPTPAAQ
jgi:hypothetical protein